MQISQQELNDIAAAVQPYKSRRIKILKALEAILNTIKKENGYTETVNEVTFDTKSWRDMPAPRTPAIFIIDDVVQVQRFVGRGRDYTWTVRLFGVVKEFTFEQFEEHIADVEECIEDNSSLCGVVSKCEINNVITDNQLFESSNNRLYEMEIQVEYRRCLGNPR